MTTPTTNDPQQQPPPSASECPCGHPKANHYDETMQCLGVVGQRCKCPAFGTATAPSTGATASGEDLLGTTDAMEWARAFVALNPSIGEDVAVAWFANAIQVGRWAGEGEVAQLRSDLAHAQAEREKLHEAWVLECNLADSRGRDRDYLRAQVEAMRPVVEAAREVRDCHGETNLTARGHRRLKAALDQAQPPQQQQEVPD